MPNGSSSANSATELANGTLYPDATPEDYARVSYLAEGFATNLAAERPDLARTMADWAERAGLVAAATKADEIEAVLATTWHPFAERGFYELLVVLGLEDPQHHDDHEEPGVPGKPEAKRPAD